MQFSCFFLDTTSVFSINSPPPPLVVVLLCKLIFNLLFGDLCIICLFSNSRNPGKNYYRQLSLFFFSFFLSFAINGKHQSNTINSFVDAQKTKLQVTNKECLEGLLWTIPDARTTQTLTEIVSGRRMLRLQMGFWGASPRASLGSFMKATRAAASWSGSRIFTMLGKRFSRKALKLM